MFTSRAEYRLMLREDNADLRLMDIGKELGLISADQAKEMGERKALIEDEILRIRKTVIKPQAEVNAYLTSKQTNPIDNGVHLDQLLKRAELNYEAVDHLAPRSVPLDAQVSRQVEIEIKYEGYIKRQVTEIARFKHLEQIKIPAQFDYSRIHGLSNELKEKLDRVRPTSLGQASRISGITPAAISVLMMAIRVNEKGTGGDQRS